MPTPTRKSPARGASDVRRPPYQPGHRGLERRARAALALALALPLLAPALGACGGEGGKGGKDDDKGKGELIGIAPSIFKCADLVSDAQVGEALGGEASLMQVAFEPPPGVAEPCNYMLAVEGEGQQPWTFDVDCRSDALRTADKLFAQYSKTSTTDAGVATNETQSVNIGRKALDHHGQALLAVDDDTDCYIRVMGPTAAGREELGKLVIEQLVWKNAPMRPRAK